MGETSGPTGQSDASCERGLDPRSLLVEVQDICNSNVDAVDPTKQNHQQNNTVTIPKITLSKIV